MICHVCALKDEREPAIGSCRDCRAMLCARHLDEQETSPGRPCQHTYLAA